MATDHEPEGGFLSRWSRRKVQVRQGAPVAEEPLRSLPAEEPVAAVPARVVAPPAPASAPAQAQAPALPPPTLADAAQLTPASDFTRFVARGVDPSVKNAALKTLFTDPHFNVMDGLDTYIEDYGLADPIPLAMLRQMAQSKALGLFADDDTDKDRDTEENPADENTAVRLQPDDAAGFGGDRPDADAHAGGECGRAGDDAHPAVPA
ncbi:DUF3306 domain-containing protein [Sphaerotilus sp.]|uniref:DUF3306 domain-containing protein n=1 Tax=Sphaerotilus sp. TaxID=2093942 RepID=UPI002ACD7904|nr:DUF3306 domain-containing protein [Sphaerotilus sp.]MDZ7856365.1 DUF3306 domain-containing protein [Sphaerotilus sp.]